MAAWLAQRRKAEERLRLERLERMEHLTPEESLRAYPALWEFRPATRVDIPPLIRAMRKAADALNRRKTRGSP